MQLTKLLFGPMTQQKTFQQLPQKAELLSVPVRATLTLKRLLQQMVRL